MLARIVSMMVVVVAVVVMMMMVVLVLVAIFATERVSRYLPRNRSDHPSAQRRSQEGAAQAQEDGAGARSRRQHADDTRERAFRERRNLVHDHEAGVFRSAEGE